VQPRAATLTVARLAADFIADRTLSLATKTQKECSRMATACLGTAGELLARDAPGGHQALVEGVAT
jgi:hypothetical protein